MKNKLLILSLLLMILFITSCSAVALYDIQNIEVTITYRIITSVSTHFGKSFQSVTYKSHPEQFDVSSSFEIDEGDVEFNIHKTRNIQCLTFIREEVL